MDKFWLGPDGLSNLSVLAKYLVNEEGYDGDDIARAISSPWRYQDEFIKAMQLYNVPGAPPPTPTPAPAANDEDEEELMRARSKRITPDQIASNM